MMKNKSLVIGFLLPILLIITYVSGAIVQYQTLKKMDSTLLTKIQEPGEENISVIVWVDTDNMDEYAAANIGTIKKEFSIIPAVSMDVPKSKLQQLASLGFVKKVVIDHKVTALRNDANPIMRDDFAMNSFGYNGTNIKTAIIDTGVYNHTEFQSPNRIILQQCFTQNACPPNNSATSSNSTDDNGHGTHVTGIAAGKGGSNGHGSAPNATIMAIKVLDSSGGGSDSDVVSGIQWAVDNGANIISMSLGTPYNQFTDCYDAGSSAAVDNATSRGVVVIIAAGNSGSSSSTIAAPGCAKTAITVGATDKTDKIASYSSRGPSNDNRTKPDLVATGSSITSAYLNNGYQTLSGTSMATPFVSGIAALVMQKYNNTFGYMPKPGLVKAILINAVNISNMTIDGYTQRNNVYGAGRIDAYDALNTMNNARNDSITQAAQKFQNIFVSSTSLRVTLTWLENSTTRNHLKLMVGNATNNFTNPTDNNDTVEQVFLSNMNNGTWTIYVNGTIVTGTQEYFVTYSANQIFPIFSNNLTSKISGVQYAPKENYTFQTQVNASSFDQVSSVIFELNNTNYTKSTTYNVANDSSGNFWINITDLSAGIYAYQWFANSTQNNWNSTVPSIFIISKNYSLSFINLTINGTNGDASYPYGSITNVTAWKAFSEGNLTLYRNSSLIGTSSINKPNETLILSGGIFNYTVVLFDAQNYSYVNITRILTITRSPTNVTLLLNGTLGSFVFNVTQVANFTSYVNITGKNITLTSNVSGWVDQNSTNAIYNQTVMNSLGIFNITAYFAGDQNYSASSQTFFATVVDISSPLILGNATYPNSGIQYYPGRTYFFNITLQEDLQVSTVILQLNSTNYTSSLYSGSTSLGNWSINITDLSASTTGYPIIWYANDTSNNWNKTAAWYYTINKNSSVYAKIGINTTTTIEIPSPFQLNSTSPSDSRLETRLYINNSLQNLTLLNSSTGLTTYNYTAFPTGVFNISANVSGNENYTSNATLEYVILKFVDTTPPTFAGGIVLPRTVAENQNVSVLIISDDYSANTAIVNIYNVTNSSVVQFNLNYIINIAPATYLNRTTFFGSLNITNLNDGVFFANVSLTDFWNNSANYTLGNFTINKVNSTILYSNSSVPVKSLVFVNLSSQMNISLNISTNSNSGLTDSIEVASYVNNPSNPNTNAVSINKYSDIIAGGWLNYTLNWVEMRFFYNTSDVPAGYSQNNLRVYYNHPNGSWVPYDGSNVGGVNTTSGYVWANSTHFSIYGVFVMPTCSDGIQNQGETGVDCGGPCAPCSSSSVSSTSTSGGGGGGSSSVSTTTTTTMIVNTISSPPTTTSTTITTTTTTTTTTLNQNVTQNATKVGIISRIVNKIKSYNPAVLFAVSVILIVIIYSFVIVRHKKTLESILENLRPKK